MTLRASDVQPMVRKVVFSAINIFGAPELKLACQTKDLKFVPLIFKAIRDEEMAGIALQTCLLFLTKSQKSLKPESLKVIEKNFYE